MKNPRPSKSAIVRSFKITSTLERLVMLRHLISNNFLIRKSELAKLYHQCDVKSHERRRLDGWQGTLWGLTWLKKLTNLEEAFSLSEHYPKLAATATEALKRRL